MGSCVVNFRICCFGSWNDVGSKIRCSIFIIINCFESITSVNVGGFTSIPGAIVGGFIIGAGEKLFEFFMAPIIGGATENWFAYVLHYYFWFLGLKVYLEKNYRKSLTMLYREVGEFKTSYAQDSQTFPIKFDRYRYYFVIIVGLLFIPFVINDYWANAVFLPFLIYAIASLGFNILTGYCGQVSLGTGGFMAVGAYASYKLMTAFPDLNIFNLL